MANHCDNHLYITTSVSPEKFLTQVMDSLGQPKTPPEWTFECREDICPFNSPNPLDSFPYWGTKWVDCHNCEWINHIEPLPKEDEPIVFTVWTRRFPIYRWPKKEPYKYTTWEISFTSAWAPPCNYYDVLFKKLKALDDRTTIQAWFYEPGNWVLWSWSDGDEYNDDMPERYWCELIDKDIISNRTDLPDSWLEFNDPSECALVEEALMELNSIGTPDAMQEIEEIKIHFDVNDTTLVT